MRHLSLSIKGVMLIHMTHKNRATRMRCQDVFISWRNMNACPTEMLLVNFSWNERLYSLAVLDMMKLLQYLLLLTSLLLARASAKDTDKKSYEALYAVAKNSYLANDWRNCIKFMKASLEAFSNYRRIVKECRENCDVSKDTSTPSMEDILPSLIKYEETMRFYESLINSTLCMMKCKRAKLGSYENPHPDPDIVRDFHSRLTYDYLQSCYNKVEEYKNAADAAFTNLAVNHESEVMKDNLKFYLEKDTSIKYEDLVNLETKRFVTLFREGVDAYEKKDFDSVIRFFELAIIEYIDAWKVCRLNCDKPFDMGWFPDFMTSTANHFTYCLRCKQNCPSKLANLDGEFYHDIFPLMYHYLQFAYYQKNDTRKSAEALESYLILYDSEEMSQNKNFFLDLPEIKKEGEASWFIPRKEAQEYHAVLKRENDLINTIEATFKFDDDVDVSSVDTQGQSKPEPPEAAHKSQTEL